MGRPRKQPSEAEQKAAAGSRVSQRQLDRGTLQKIRNQQLMEDLEFAAHERATAERMRQGKRPAPPQPAAAAAGAGAGAGTTTAVGPDGEVVVVVKKRRGRAPKPRPPAPPKPAIMGPRLDAVLADVRAAVDTCGLAPGTPVWVKVTGYSPWPALVWSLDLCARFIWPDIIANYEKGKVLVRYYGDHSNSWVAHKQLVQWDDADVASKNTALTQWGKKNSRVKLVAATIDELAARSDDRAEELCRMDRLGRVYNLDFLQATARHRHNTLLRPNNTAPGAAGDGGGEAVGGSSGLGQVAERAAAAAAAAAAASNTLPVTANAWGTCDICREEVPDLRCSSCHRWLHALCATPAALTAAEYPADQSWTCPCCSADNTVTVQPEEELLRQAAGQGAVAERMGLTPDWIISTGAFTVFQLPRPTADQPYIAGLLDPACNNKAEPNIPAEVLYDKNDDGLDPNNSWKGYYVLLNPDFRAQVQWRFVNRAIDEVENGNVPAVLLICRNSTDTAFFQRLRPYPRVLLRRCNTQFKDYEKCAIGFGVVVFCIATASHQNCLQLYERFYAGFSAFGEPNIPIDTEFLTSPSFYQLLSRLRLHAEQQLRVQWAQCSKCGVWRIITWQQQQGLISEGGTTEWTCSMLRPPFTSCATPQTKRELAGIAALEPTIQQTAAGEAAGPSGTAAAGAPGAAAGVAAGAAAAAGPQTGAARFALPAAPPADPAAAPAVAPSSGTTAATGTPQAAGGAGGEVQEPLQQQQDDNSTAAAATAAAAATSAPTDMSTDGTCLDSADLQLLDAPTGCNADGSSTPTQAGAAPAAPAADAAVAAAADAAAQQLVTASGEAEQGPGGDVDSFDAAATSGDAPTTEPQGAAAPAADMWGVFESDVGQVQRDVAAAYLCKSAAGQVTIQQARELLAAAAAAAAARGGAAGDGSGGDASAAREPQLEQLLPLDANQATETDTGKAPQAAGAAAGASDALEPTSGGAGGGGALDGRLMNSAPLTLSVECPGLSVLAPVVLLLVEQWLHHIVHSLLQQMRLQAEQQQQQQVEQQAEQEDKEALGKEQQQQQMTQAVLDQLMEGQLDEQPAGQHSGGDLDSTAAAVGAAEVLPASDHAAAAQDAEESPAPEDTSTAADAEERNNKPPAAASTEGTPCAAVEDTTSCCPAAQAATADGAQLGAAALGAAAAAAAAAQIQAPAETVGQQQQPPAIPHMLLLPPRVLPINPPGSAAMTPVMMMMMPPAAVAAAAAAAAAAAGGRGLPLCWGQGPAPLLQQEQQQQAMGYVRGPLAPVTPGGVFAASASTPWSPTATLPAAQGGSTANVPLLPPAVVLQMMQAQQQQGAVLSAPQQLHLVQQQQQVFFQRMLAQHSTGPGMRLALAQRQQLPGGVGAGPMGIEYSNVPAAGNTLAPPAFVGVAAAAAAGAGTDSLAAVPAAPPAQTAAAATGAKVAGGAGEEAQHAPPAAAASAAAVNDSTTALTHGDALGAPAPAVQGAADDAQVAPATATAHASSVSGDSGSSRSLLAAAFKGPAASTGGSAEPASAPTTPLAAAAAAAGAAAQASQEASTTPAATAPAPAAAGQRPSSAAQGPGGAAFVALACRIRNHVDVLRPRAVWDLTGDPLLRAVLLEQPCLMETVLALVKRMAATVHPQLLDSAAAGAGNSKEGGLGHHNAAAAADAPGAAAAAGGGSGAAAAVCCGIDVDMDTLDSLCSQPMQTDGAAWPKRPQGGGGGGGQQLQLGGQVTLDGDGVVDDEGGVCGVPAAVDDTGAEEAEMLSSLELARAARMAANKAFMLGLGLGQPIGAPPPPGVTPLAPNSGAVVAAARKLASQAAVQRARRQLDASQRLLDARRRARRQQEKRLRATLEALTADEAAAAQQVADAMRTLQDMRQEAFGG